MSLSKSGIPYLTHAWDPVVGCTRGCDYCWAARLARRIGKATGCDLCVRFRPHVHAERLVLPLGAAKTIGVGFMSDMFGPVAGWQVVNDVCPGTDWWETSTMQLALRNRINMDRVCRHTFVTSTRCPQNIPANLDPPDNWWLLLTATTQREVDERLPVALRRWPAGRVILNLEPLISPANPCEIDTHQTWPMRAETSKLDALRGFTSSARSEGPTGCRFCDTEERSVAGVILGGMSGPKAVDFPLDPEWVRSVRDQCAVAGVPFALKQMSGPRPEPWPLLDGRRHTDLPWTRAEAGE